MGEQVHCQRCETCDAVTPHTKRVGRVIGGLAILTAPTIALGFLLDKIAASITAVAILFVYLGRHGFKLPWLCERCRYRGHRRQVAARGRGAQTWRRETTLL